MEYKYYNQFNLSDQLSNAISMIISKNEKEDYVCKILTLTIPEHKGLVFRSPLTDEDICRPGYSALSGAQINDINERYGKYIEGTIPEEDYCFLVVMKNEFYKIISKQSFKNEEEIKGALQVLSVFSQEYDGIFDSRTLIKKFPYLQDFFTGLDNWRAQTGRVTIDDNVLTESTERTLCKRKSINR